MASEKTTVRQIWRSSRLTVQRNRPFFFHDSAAGMGGSDQQQCVDFGVHSLKTFSLDQCFSNFSEEVIFLFNERFRLVSMV